MRDFSRSVMRHYAPLPDDNAAVAQSAPPASPLQPPTWTEPANTPTADTQYVASAPLPFDTPAAEPAAPLLPPAEFPVYAPDPPLPQYVVPSTPPAPAVQRTEQAARPASDIATGPDGKPLMYNGKPIPIDNNPTPPALLELMRRDRERSAEVQRLKEERTEMLKAELPPPSEDGDAPRSSRIRRRGSADVDYIQTKALSDKREPGDTAADPKPNVKSPREPEQQEVPPPDDDDEWNGDSFDGEPPFEAPTDAAPLTPPTDISTASDTPAVQRDSNIAAPVPSIPFDAPVDVPVAEPEVVPDTLESGPPFAVPTAPVPSDAPIASPIAIQHLPDLQDSNVSQYPDTTGRPPSASAAAERPVHDVARPSAAPQAAAPTVQRQTEPKATAPPLHMDKPGLTPHDANPDGSPSTPDVLQAQPSATAQPLPQTVQRHAAPEISPSLPFDVPATQPGLPDELQTPVMPVPDMPSIQREIDPGIPTPSLPFEVPAAVDVPAIKQFESPEIPTKQVANAQEAPPAAASVPALSSPATAQHEDETATSATTLPRDSQPFEQANVQEANPPRRASVPDTPSGVVPHAPAVQRQSNPADSALPIPFDEPAVSEPDAPHIAQAALPDVSPLQQSVKQEPSQVPVSVVPSAPTAAVQRQPEPIISTPSPLFDAPADVQPAAPDDVAPAFAPVDASPAKSNPPVQREIDPERVVSPLPFDTPPMPQSAQAALQEQVSAPAETMPPSPVPTVQRRLEADIPTLAITLDEPSDQPISDGKRRSLTAAETQSPAADIQRLTASEARVPGPHDVPIAPRAAADAPQSDAPENPPHASMPTLQRRVETDTPIPFDAPQIDAAAAQHVAHEPSMPPVQRRTDTENAALLPLDAVAPGVPFSVEAAAQTAAPDIQPLSDSAVVPVQHQTEQDAKSPLPFEATAEAPILDAPQTAPEASGTASDGQPDVPAQRVQRQLNADTPQVNLPDLSRVQTLDALVPEVARAGQPAAQAPAPPIQRHAEAEVTAPPLPYDLLPSTAEPLEAQAEQPAMPEVVEADRVSAAPAIQRQVEARPSVSHLPYDLLPSTTELLEAQAEQPAMPEVVEADRVSAANTPPVTPGSAAPAIQRQVEAETPVFPPLPFDTPVGETEYIAPRAAASEQTIVSEAASLASPTTVSSAPVTPSLQRQADPSIHVPAAESQLAAPTMLPFDDLDMVAAQRMPVQSARAVTQVPEPVRLPFDPVAPAETIDIQRTPEPLSADPFSTPDTMPAGASAESPMDVFQALVAAGMVSRPPGGKSMPTAASARPLLQRSPSREAYLANMAQQQESAGAVSGPIQRALSEVNVPDQPAEDTEEDEAPEININQLASDVMRVLRGKLRSEHERLSKR